jgi:CIC family chloride channel protein
MPGPDPEPQDANTEPPDPSVSAPGDSSTEPPPLADPTSEASEETPDPPESSEDAADGAETPPAAAEGDEPDATLTEAPADSPREPGPAEPEAAEPEEPSPPSGPPPDPAESPGVSVAKARTAWIVPSARLDARAAAPREPEPPITSWAPARPFVPTQPTPVTPPPTEPPPSSPPLTESAPTVPPPTAPPSPQPTDPPPPPLVTAQVPAQWAPASPSAPEPAEPPPDPPIDDILADPGRSGEIPKPWWEVDPDPAEAPAEAALPVVEEAAPADVPPPWWEVDPPALPEPTPAPVEQAPPDPSEPPDVRPPWWAVDVPEVPAQREPPALRNFEPLPEPPAPVGPVGPSWPDDVSAHDTAAWAMPAELTEPEAPSPPDLSPFLPALAAERRGEPMVSPILAAAAAAKQEKADDAEKAKSSDNLPAVIPTTGSAAPFWYQQPSEPGERAKQFYAWARKVWTSSTTPHAEAGEPSEVGYRTQQILVLSAATGVLVGLVAVVLEKATLEWLPDPLEDQPLWLRAAGPAVGLIVAWAALRFLTNRASPATTDAYIQSYHTSPHEPLGHGSVLGRTVAAVGTIGYGGALGPDGPGIYLGAVIGSTLQQRLARFFSREDAKALMVAGAAAGVAAVFKAPATGALFAIEVPYQTDVARRVGLPAMIGAVTGYVTAALMDGTEPLFPIAGSSAFDGKDLVGALIVGLLCGLGARGFSIGLAQLTEQLAKVPVWARLAGAGLVLFGLAFLSEAAFDRPLSLGAGYDVIFWAGGSAVSLWLIGAMLGIRLAAVVSTWGGGGVGGFFLPLLVSGALIGRLAGGAIGFADTELLLVVGMAAFLGAGYRTPLAAVLFVAETTGRAGFVVPALVAVAVAQLVVGRTSVSPAQRAGRLGHLERRRELPISAVLETDVRTVPPDATLEELLDFHLVASRRRAVPVVGSDNRFLGLAELDEIVHVRREAWSTTTIETIARTDAPRGRTTWLVRDALAAMERAGTDMLPIIDGQDRFVGLVTTEDILNLDEILDRTAKAR